MSGNPHNTKTELSRELTLFQLTMMGLGMMIGAAVFIGIGNSIKDSGPGGVMLTFGLNGVVAIFTAMSYAELSSAIPRAGGALHFARLAFGKGPSFIAGWMEWFASSVAGSMYAITFSIYVVRYIFWLGWLSWLPELQFTGFLSSLSGGPDVYLVKPVAVVVAILFLYINYRGVSETGKIGALMTLGQTVFLLFIGVVGVVVAIRNPDRLQNFTPFLPKGWSALLVTMGFTSVAFEGYEVIAQAGDEAINPRKTLPKAMLLSVAIAAVTYVLVSFATVVSVNAGDPDITIPAWQWIAQFGEKGFGEAVGRLIPAGNFLLTLAVIFASTSALNATIFSATRAAYALGRDKMLPKIFARVSKKRKTPSGSLTMVGIVLVIVAAFLPTKDVASSASIMFLFLFFIVNICVIRIRYRMGEELEYGFIMPLFPLFPILALVSQAVLAFFLHETSKMAWFIAPGWIISGILIYFFYARKRSSASEDEIQTLHAEGHEDLPGGMGILIPIANPNNADMLCSLAKKIHPSEEAHVDLLHMVPVPDQLALEDAEKYMTVGQEGLDKAEQLLEDLFPVSKTIRYCRNIARGIFTTARERRSQLMLLGWHGKKTNHLFQIGSTLDPVISRAPCNVIILKDDMHKVETDYKKILVPLFGNINDALSMVTAERLMGAEGGSITALYFNRMRMRPGHIHNILKNIISREDIRIDEVASDAHDRVETVAQTISDHDLVVLGIREPRLYSMGRASESERIVRKSDKPFVLVKATSNLKGWLKRWLI